MNVQRLMVVVAHPDDESFPIGGTIAKTAAEGGEVMLVTATRGEAGVPDLQPDEAGRLRERELRAACEVLGVKALRFLDYVDGTLNRVEAETAIGQLIDLMRAFRPDVIITFGPDGISGHPDHLAVHRWTAAAFERARRAGWARRLYYITPSEATAQGCGVPPSNEQAGGAVAFIDVGAHLITKVRAMQCHASQQPPVASDPEEAASHLVCHETFTRVWPTTGPDTEETLFESAAPYRSHVATTPMFVAAP
jgi:LmbE family N-acetylglucosaminyl deacetylase